MDTSGAAPLPATVREMANFLAKRGSATTLSIGPNWVSRFVKRREDIRTRHSERYDYQHAQNEDLTTLREWFNTVQYSLFGNSILPVDICSYDGTGFAIGLISTAKVVTRVQYMVGKWLYSLEIVSG